MAYPVAQALPEVHSEAQRVSLLQAQLDMPRAYMLLHAGKPARWRARQCSCRAACNLAPELRGSVRAVAEVCAQPGT